MPEYRRLLRSFAIWKWAIPTSLRRVKSDLIANGVRNNGMLHCLVPETTHAVLTLQTSITGMTIESYRSQLMAQKNSRQWGDMIPILPYTSPGATSPSPAVRVSQIVTFPQLPSAPHFAHDDDHIIQPDRSFPRRSEGRQFPDNGPDIDALDSQVPLFSTGTDETFVMASTRGWSLEEMLDEGHNFHSVERVSASSPNLLQTIKKFEERGIPLVIGDFHKHPKWPQHMFTIDHFSSNCGRVDINVRNVHDWTDTTIPLRDFIAKCRVSGPYRTETERERFYGKDSECPQTWDDWLQSGDVIPKELTSKGPEDMFRHRPANPEAAVETLMCYIGIGDTFTPCHKDLCASSGQNLMCYTESDGSSFWFMTASSSASKASEYFLSLGQELDHENYILTFEELKKAPFKIYVLEQKLGDMVLVPPRSCHQVVNSGGITLKTSWSRMTAKGLATAFHHELPIYRRVCRPETYRIKSTAYHALVALTRHLGNSLNQSIDGNGPVLDNLQELLLVFEAILTEEYDEDVSAIPVTSKLTAFDDDNRLVCDFCSADIFQSFFECQQCCDSSDESCHLCPGCYSEGRTCRCSIPNMKPMQCRDFQMLRDASANALKVIGLYEERFNRKSSNLQREIDIIRKDTPALFRASCRVYKKRAISIKKSQKICRMQILNEHNVQFFSALACSKCTLTRCYPHILSEYKMHSAEALLLHESDEHSDLYHEIHMGAKERFENDIKSLEKTRKKGIRPRGSQCYSMLVDNAERYIYCRPANLKFMQLGWYDKNPPFTTNSRSSEPSTLSSSAQEDLAHEQKAIVPSPNILLVSTNEPVKNTQLAILGRRSSVKRKFEVYIEVPQAPYDISRFEPALQHHVTQKIRGRDRSQNSTSFGQQPRKEHPPSIPVRPATLSSSSSSNRQILKAKSGLIFSIPAENPVDSANTPSHSTSSSTIPFRKKKFPHNLRFKKFPDSIPKPVDNVDQSQESSVPQVAQTLASPSIMPTISVPSIIPEAKNHEESSASAAPDCGLLMFSTLDHICTAFTAATQYATAAATALPGSSTQTQQRPIPLPWRGSHTSVAPQHQGNYEISENWQDLHFTNAREYERRGWAAPVFPVYYAHNQDDPFSQAYKSQAQKIYPPYPPDYNQDPYYNKVDARPYSSYEGISYQNKVKRTSEHSKRPTSERWPSSQKRHMRLERRTWDRTQEPNQPSYSQSARLAPQSPGFVGDRNASKGPRRFYNSYGPASKHLHHMATGYMREEEKSERPFTLSRHYVETTRDSQSQLQRSTYPQNERRLGNLRRKERSVKKKGKGKHSVPGSVERRMDFVEVVATTSSHALPGNDPSILSMSESPIEQGFKEKRRTPTNDRNDLPILNEGDDMLDDNWEDGYEKPEDVVALPPAEFRMEGIPRSREPLDDSGMGHELINNPWKSSPWS